MANTAAQLIEDRGGSAVFSQATGIPHGAVRTMKHRNRIPRRAWPEIQKAYPDVTLDRLLETEAAADAEVRA